MGLNIKGMIKFVFALFLFVTLIVPCFRIINAGYGVLTTPGYPGTYTQGECVWYVDVGDGVAKVSVDSINSTYYSSSCSVSQIEVNLLTII